MTEKDRIQRPQCIWCNRVFTNANLKTSNLNEHYNNRHGSVQSGNDFSTLNIKRAWFDSGGTLLKQAFVPTMGKQLLLACCKVTFLCESLIQLLKNLWHHVNYVGNSNYLPSDKGYERILWNLRGYECVERLRTTAVESLNSSLAPAAGDLWPKKGRPIAVVKGLRTHVKNYRTSCRNTRFPQKMFRNWKARFHIDVLTQRAEGKSNQRADSCICLI